MLCLLETFEPPSHPIKATLNAKTHTLTTPQKLPSPKHSRLHFGNCCRVESRRRRAKAGLRLSWVTKHRIKGHHTRRRYHGCLFFRLVHTASSPPSLVIVSRHYLFHTTTTLIQSCISHWSCHTTHILIFSIKLFAPLIIVVFICLDTHKEWPRHLLFTRTN